MSNNNGRELFGIEQREIRNEVIDVEAFFVRKEHPAINDNIFILCPDESHV
jgi:hypothetical protein